MHFLSSDCFAHLESSWCGNSVGQDLHLTETEAISYTHHRSVDANVNAARLSLLVMNIEDMG